MHTLARSLVALLLLTAMLRADPPADLSSAVPPEGAPVVTAAAEAPIPGGIFGAGHIIFDGEFFAWAPRQRGTDYAIQGTANFGPIGTIKTLEGGYDPGFRIAAGYKLPGDGLEAVFAYTQWHSATDDSVNALPGGNVFSTLTHPALVVSVASASATSSINLNVFDIEFGRRFELSESTNARVFFGPRIANLDQKLTAVYQGGDVVSDTVRRNQTFDGGGLRIGGETNFKFLEHMSLFLRGSGSLMTGRITSSLGETANDQQIVNVTDRFTRIVPTLDLGIGLSYQRGGFRLSAGYEFHNWFGVVDGLDFTDDVHLGKIGRQTGDLGFDGMFIHCELLF